MASKEDFRGHQLERQLIVHDVPVNVEFTFYKGHEGGDDEPPEYDYVEIDRVLVDEVNVLNLIGDRTLDTILDKIHKMREEESCSQSY